MFYEDGIRRCFWVLLDPIDIPVTYQTLFWSRIGYLKPNVFTFKMVFQNNVCTSP